MSRIWCLYSPKELEGLDDNAKGTLQKELKKQVQLLEKSARSLTRMRRPIRFSKRSCVARITS